MTSTSYARPAPTTPPGRPPPASERSTPRRQWRPGPTLLAMSAGSLALFAWSGMVAQPLGFLVPTLLVGLVMALAGSALRFLGWAPYAVAGAQLLIALLSLNLIFAARESLLAVIPTEDSVRRVAYAVGNGAATLNHYSAPVEVNPTHTSALLLSCALAVLLAVDVLGLGLRRPPLIALPLLVTLSIPVSILSATLALPVFVGTALLFLRLLATENLDRYGSWNGDRRAAGRTSQGPVLATLWQVSLIAVLVSLAVAPIVPVTDLLDRELGGAGTNAGQGGRFQLTAVNPFIRLRRDLVQKTNTPLVYAETEARSTSYLRTTVLDQFTSGSWRPSPRNLPSDNNADGVFPNPPGLAPGIGGAEDEWSLRLAPSFGTTWLPLPYPIRELDISGGWRYDSRTLDVAYVGGRSPSEISYTATSFAPAITADLLETSVRAPLRIREPMTSVPDDLPDVITTRAREVTEGAAGNFAKAVAIQDWFRQDGGFRYSLEQRSGSGMDLLAAFVTDDRVGYCEQFAAAMAAMGRALNIPSRVVVGFLDGTTQPDGKILYTSDDRHAWPEMYFSGLGWVRFEPTPGQRAGATPSWTRESVSAPEPSAAPSDAAEDTRAPGADAAAAEAGSGNRLGLPVPWWPVLALLVVVVLGLTPTALRRVQRRRRLSGRTAAELAEGAWAELRAVAVDLGLDWSEHRSAREQATRLVGQVQATVEDLSALDGLLVQLERSRYARAGAGADERESVDEDLRAQTRHVVETWHQVMLRSVDRQHEWRGRVWPVSVVQR